MGEEVEGIQTRRRVSGGKVIALVSAGAILALLGAAVAWYLLTGREKPYDPRQAARIQETAAKSLGVPKETALDLGSGVPLRLVLIPAGAFLMGSPDTETDREKDEGPRREVRISRPFYLGVFAVTQEQYRQVTGRNPSSFQGSQNPVESVPWDEAVEFCKALSQRTGKKARLPTEAEWEYACRAGCKKPFSYGDDKEYRQIGDHAWYFRNSGNRTHPVGGKKPNAWGLYDMHGNVWQWCSDWYAASDANAVNVDPPGPGSGTARVLRGAGWCAEALVCRTAHRDCLSPASRYNYLGFRVAVELK